MSHLRVAQGDSLFPLLPKRAIILETSEGPSEGGKEYNMMPDMSQDTERELRELEAQGFEVWIEGGEITVVDECERVVNHGYLGPDQSVTWED